jgi:hypothetical protein
MARGSWSPPRSKLLNRSSLEGGCGPAEGGWPTASLAGSYLGSLNLELGIAVNEIETGWAGWSGARDDPSPIRSSLLIDNYSAGGSGQDDVACEIRFARP